MRQQQHNSFQSTTQKMFTSQHSTAVHAEQYTWTEHTTHYGGGREEEQSKLDNISWLNFLTNCCLLLPLLSDILAQ